MHTPSTYYSDKQWNQWLSQLAADDYLILDNFISDELYLQVQAYFQDRLNEHNFSKAAIGSSEDRLIEANIRGDFIYWLDSQQDAALRELFDLFEEVKLQLRQQLFLSLSDYEFHFALYPPNTGYRKHLDQFKGNNNRLISMLIYLNDGWEDGDGGELKIYRTEGDDLFVQPLAKRLVLFRSDIVEHEVTLTRKHRKSLTGWLLQKPASLNQLM